MTRGTAHADLAAAHAGGKGRPSLVPGDDLEPSAWGSLGWLTLIALLPRLLLMFVNENYFGDAVVRSELGERWAVRPHWITSFDSGAYQFGPLHIYLMGLAAKVWPAREHAGRVLSLLFGAATVLPLHAVTTRWFGVRAAIAACLAFAAWGMHLQFSTTAGSEALGLFLLLSMVALLAQGWEEGRFAPLAGAAVMLNLLCATRYDAWMLIPLICLLLLLADKDKVAAVTRAVGFGLFCLPFPLVWMHGNELARGDPFYPVRFIDQFHRAWFHEGVAVWGEASYRLQNLFFWPGTALVTLSPLVALLGGVGMVRAFLRRPELRWVVWVALVPTAYFTFRGAVLGTFVPLARFTVNQLALLLPFVAEGFEAMVGKARRPVRQALLALTVALAVACPLFLGLFTYQREGKWEDSLRPVSPTSTQPAPVREVAAFLKREVNEHGEAVILDEGEPYLDLALAFFSGLPESRLVRYRWEIFPERLVTADPRYLVLIDGGRLSQSPDFAREGDTVRLQQARFEELPGAPAPFHVYRRISGAFF